jgi:hypothetical protein
MKRRYEAGMRIEITDPAGAGRRGTVVADPRANGRTTLADDYVVILLDGHTSAGIWPENEIRVLNLLEVIAEAARDPTE